MLVWALRLLLISQWSRYGIQCKLTRCVRAKKIITFKKNINNKSINITVSESPIAAMMSMSAGRKAGTDWGTVLDLKIRLLSALAEPKRSQRFSCYLSSFEKYTSSSDPHHMTIPACPYLDMITRQWWRSIVIILKHSGFGLRKLYHLLTFYLKAATS